MKIRLLNSCGYIGMDNVEFPVEVEGELYGRSGFMVLGSEIMRVGGGAIAWDPDWEYCWTSSDAEKAE